MDIKPTPGFAQRLRHVFKWPAIVGVLFLGFLQWMEYLYGWADAPRPGGILHTVGAPIVRNIEELVIAGLIPIAIWLLSWILPWLLRVVLLPLLEYPIGLLRYLWKGEKR